MKKIFLFFAFSIAAMQFANAQINYGIKGGLNYNTTDVAVSGASGVSTDSNSGYHAGLWLRIKVPVVGLYLRPEVVYTSLKSDYSFGTYTLNKIDIPVLVGMKFLGVGNIFVGPSFQYLLNSDLKVGGIDVSNSLSKDLSIGLQVGLGVEFWKLGVDVRYETGLSKAENSFGDIASTLYKIDTQPNQFIVGLSYKF